MKNTLGIIFCVAWAVFIVPFAWKHLFPESEGFSVTQLIVAGLPAPIIYGIGSKIGEAIDKWGNK